MPEIKRKTRGLEGLRVLSLQRRHAEQMVKLIENEGGEAVSAPSMREVPVEENPAAIAFAEALFAGQYDLVIFLTGVGTRMLFNAVEKSFQRERLVEALSRVQVVARGPKSVTPLREWAIPIALSVPEPNTWRDILKSLDGHPALAALQGKRIAIQEYGVSNQELTEALEARGATVSGIQVYQWSLPEDIEPLKRGIGEVVAGRIDVLLVTSATQVDHMMEVASWNGLEDAVRMGLERAVVVSVGPIATEGLARHGIVADMEPIHPRMGQLVHDAAQRVPALLKRKRRET